MKASFLIWLRLKGLQSSIPSLSLSCLPRAPSSIGFCQSPRIYSHESFIIGMQHCTQHYLYQLGVPDLSMHETTNKTAPLPWVETELHQHSSRRQCQEEAEERTEGSRQYPLGFSQVSTRMSEIKPETLFQGGTQIWSQGILVAWPKSKSQVEEN